VKKVVHFRQESLVHFRRNIQDITDIGNFVKKSSSQDRAKEVRAKLTLSNIFDTLLTFVSFALFFVCLCLWAGILFCKLWFKVGFERLPNVYACGEPAIIILF
jgi:hypothetical protein